MAFRDNSVHAFGNSSAATSGASQPPLRLYGGDLRFCAVRREACTAETCTCACTLTVNRGRADARPSWKMVDIHDVSGVVGWCLGACSAVEKLIFTIFTPFFTLGPVSTTLYSRHAVSHGLISSTTFLQHSTVYSSTAVLQSTTSTPPLWILSVPKRSALSKRTRTLGFLGHYHTEPY